MRCTHAAPGPMWGRRRGTLCVVLACATVVGCDNTCVTFVWNPGGIAPGKVPSCTFTQANGTADIRLSSIAAPPTNSESASVRHIFITLRGIQASSSEAAGEDSSDWVDLAPRLAMQPVQIDLMGPAADSCSSSLLAENVVVAGVYTQIRLRLLSNQQATSGVVPQENSCGDVGFNCIVTADGPSRPLILDGEAHEIILRSDRIQGGFLRVLPDTHTSIALEFNPYASTLLPAAEADRLSPVFTVDVRTPCDPAAP
jgi:hypothetical protein